MAGLAAALPLKTQDDLLNLGVLTMSVLGVHDKTMATVINDTIATQLTNTTYMSIIQKAMKDHGQADVPPTLALYLLQQFIESVGSKPGDQREYRLNCLRTGWLFQGVTLGFVVLRLCVKKFVVGKIRRDDWAILMAMIVSIGLSTSEQIGANEHQACEHIWNLSYNYIRENLRSLYIIELVYLYAAFAVKSALMLFYWDLVPRDTTIRFFHHSILATFALVSLITFYTTFIIAFQCRPANFWEDVATAKCLPRQVVFTLSSALIAATDLVVLACGCAIYRLILFGQFVDHTDITFNQCSVSTWSIMEGSLAIIAACIPATKALVTRYASKWRNSVRIPAPKKILDSFSFSKTIDTTLTSVAAPAWEHPNNYALEITKFSEVSQTVAKDPESGEKVPRKDSDEEVQELGISQPILRNQGSLSKSSSTEALRGSADVEQMLGTSRHHVV